MARATHLRHLGRVPGLCALGAVLLGMAGCAPPAAAGGPPPARLDPELALATFDSAWSRINHTYYDPDFRGLDWPGVRAELRPRAAAATSLPELRAVIAEMLGRIGESHFALIAADAADALPTDAAARSGSGVLADPGLEVRVLGEGVVVARVEAGGPAATAGVRPGWLIESVDDVEVERWLRARARLARPAERRVAAAEIVWRVAALLQGPPGSTVAVRFRDGGARAVPLRLARRPTPGEAVRFGNLPLVLADFEHERLELEDGCAGLIRFNIWMTPVAERFDRAMGELRDCRGIVIDLRGNPGGVGGMVMGISGHFLDRHLPLGVMKTRQGELRFVANPRRADAAGRAVRPFAGPLAILIDPMSMSTSELFAVAMQELGRARLFGETSAGQALPAMMVRLPTRDVLMHVFADFTGPSGERIEGRGAVPDAPVPLRREELLAGRDAPLEAALAWIAGEGAAAAAH